MKCPLLVSDTADPSSYFFFQNAQKRQKDKKDSRSPRRFARPGATSIPTGFGLRLSFCRFCLERFATPRDLTPTFLSAIIHWCIPKRLFSHPPTIDKSGS